MKLRHVSYQFTLDGYSTSVSGHCLLDEQDCIEAILKSKVLAYERLGYSIKGEVNYYFLDPTENHLARI